MNTATLARSKPAGRLSARRWTYFRVSRAHRYSILFALPLLLGYEVLAAALAQPGKAELRNGADAMLRSAFTAVAGQRGSLIFIGVIVLIGLVLVVRDLRQSRDRLRPGIFVGMLGESILLALFFGVVVGGVTRGVLRLVHPLAVPSGRELDWWTRLMLSLGAGLYEELLFRVLLVGALAAGARALLGWRATTAGVAAAVLGAAIFSAFHYIGPYGDRLEVYSFVFRMVAGLFFSGLYLARGFGITAWTHALYDVSLLLMQ